MKKAAFVFFIICLVAQAQAQFKIGINAGVPVGKTSDYFSLSAGGDLYYMFGDNKDGLLKFGLASGLLNYFAEDMDGGLEDSQYIPIAGAGRITFLSTLFFGADIGYGIALNEVNEGGAYGRVVGGIELGNTIELNAFYHLVKVVTGRDFASAGLGVLIIL